MRNFAAALMLARGLAFGQAPPSVELQHLYTFGSRHGIHPPRILNRRLSTAALGQSEHPYGLTFPVAVTSDARRRVWITDSGTSSVHVFDRVSGQYREIKRVGDLVLQRPSGVAADAQGRVYLTDSVLGGVFVFDENGEYDRSLTKPGAGQLESPAAIAISEDGRTIYVADPPRNVIVAFNREGEVDETIHLPEAARQPVGVSVITNLIYVLGSQQHRVETFSPNGRQRGEVRWDGIDCPSAFAYDAVRRRLLVANPRGTTVGVFNEEGQNLGVFGHFGDGIDQMQHVDFLYVDPQGLVYLVDSHQGKVLVFADAPAN